MLERVAPPASPEARNLFRQRLRQLVAEARAHGVPSASLTRELTTMAESMKS